jgi:hypothetical protein
MPVIINPTTQIEEEIQGTVILEYFGQQENFNYHTVERPSILKLKYREFGSTVKERSCDFILELEEFFNIPLTLDLMNRLVYRDGDLKTHIGVLCLEKMCYENSKLLISGRYFHNSLSLAYYMFECVKFDCLFQFDEKRDRDFKRRLKNLNKNLAELKDMIHFTD